MTIRKGEAWGEPVPAPAGLRLAATDAEASALLAAAPGEPVGLTGGDLARTMGGGTPGRFPGDVVRAPVDVLRVVADGTTITALAHVVARRRWWRGPVVLVMNAQFLGDYDAAPLSHPNDGRADVIEVAASMPLRARWQARMRARTGTHLPHPDLGTRQVREASWTFAAPLDLWVDGRRRGRARALAVTVEPDAAVVYA